MSSNSNELLTGLVSTGFTIVSYIVYKLVKRYTVNSNCKNNELHITLTSLDDKVNETHTYIKTFFESMKEECEKQKVYNDIIKSHRDKQLDDFKQTMTSNLS